MTLPEDIRRKIAGQFSSADGEAVTAQLVALRDELGDPQHRVVRCLLHLAAGDRSRLTQFVGQARVDVRDVLHEAEYDGGDRRLRNYGKPFGAASFQNPEKEPRPDEIRDAIAGQERTPSNIYPSLIYDDAGAAIDWLCRAFGFTRRLVVPGEDGAVVHSELSLGPGVIMVSSPKPAAGRVGPRSLTAVSHALCVQVDDPDAHYARARAAGAVVLQELQDEDYGSRGYMAADPEGHPWYFGTYRPGAHWDR